MGRDLALFFASLGVCALQSAINVASSEVRFANPPTDLTLRRFQSDRADPRYAPIPHAALRARTNALEIAVTIAPPPTLSGAFLHRVSQAFSALRLRGLSVTRAYARPRHFILSLLLGGALCVMFEVHNVLEACDFRLET